jgi:phage-related protein
MTTIVFFRDDGGRSPFLGWFTRLSVKAKIQCRARLQLLAEQGHMLHRPASDYLRDGIYELRARAGRVQYRMLYFFHGRECVVISHGIVKRRADVPPIEIDRALQRKRTYEVAPKQHTHEEAQ